MLTFLPMPSVIRKPRQPHPPLPHAVACSSLAVNQRYKFLYLRIIRMSVQYCSQILVKFAHRHFAVNEEGKSRAVDKMLMIAEIYAIQTNSGGLSSRI